MATPVVEDSWYFQVSFIFMSSSFLIGVFQGIKDFSSKRSHAQHSTRSHHQEASSRRIFLCPLGHWNIPLLFIDSSSTTTAQRCVRGLAREEYSSRTLNIRSNYIISNKVFNKDCVNTDQSRLPGFNYKALTFHYNASAINPYKRVPWQLAAFDQFPPHYLIF